MIRRAALLIITVGGLAWLPQGGAHAAGCTTIAALDEVSITCEVTEDEYTDLVSNSNTNNDGPTYTTTPIANCESNDGPTQCYGNNATCSGPPPGTWHNLFADGEYVGLACLSPGFDAPEVNPLPSVSQIRTAMEQLDWPAPELSVQPPGGRTLVNLETVFSTDLVEPQTRNVELLGHRVSITATPTSYTWHAGDGTTWTTDAPGTPWSRGADAAELNHHVYEQAHSTFSAHVEVTYEGRFRLNDGPERAIPGTHTVAGDTVDIAIAEAIPTLVQ